VSPAAILKSSLKITWSDHMTLETVESGDVFHTMSSVMELSDSTAMFWIVRPVAIACVVSPYVVL
jgi:hypothetical protein